MAAICPACGTANRPAAKFCMQCITPLAAEDVPPVEPFGEDKTIPYIKTEQATRSMASDALAGRVNPLHALPEGTEIEGFRILRQIGEGGFGIVYLAWDLALERHVAIKEYMPSSLAVRGAVSLEVSMRSEQQRETFDAGLKSFVNEARLLARFDHPALVKVFRYWAANGTAYMAMPYYEGPTLKTALAQLGTRPPEVLLREWLHPLLDALAVMHQEQCYHRDISPDNILLTAAGPLLLDFGAARHVINDRTQVLTTMLKPGFAPVEQYGGTMLQGAWTDLYALAGVVHYAIVGRPPIASVVRVVRDPVQPLAISHAGRYSAAFLNAIDAALAVRPESRPQDVAAFRALLDAEPTQDDATPEPSDFRGTPQAPQTRSRRLQARLAVLAVVLLVAGAALWHRERGAVTAQAPSPAATSTPVASGAAVQAPAPAPAHAPAPAPTAVAVTGVPAATAPAQRPAAALPPTPPARVADRKPAPAPRPAPASADTVVGLSEKNRTVSREQETAPSYTQSSRSPGCSDLVLKSSLEPLSPEEAAFQKTRCK